MATSDNPTPSASSPLTLLCQLVDNENLIGAVFPVDTSSTALIGHLKEQIWGKKTNTFTARGIDADQLFLWKLSSPIPTGRTRTEKAEFSRRTKAIEFPDPESDDALEGNGTIQILDSADKLSSYWRGDPREKHLHLIVQVLPPPAVSSPESRTLSINCIVSGDYPSRVFTVKIPDTDNVSALKELIKDKSTPAFDHVPARILDLWTVSIPVNGDLKENVRKVELRDEEALSPVDTLSNVFSHQPEGPKTLLEPGYVHVIVRAPPQLDDEHRGIKRKRDEDEEAKDLLLVFTEPAPSSFAFASTFEKRADGLVSCNRPLATETIPITLLQKEFAEFKRDCKLDPSTQAVRLSDELATAACKWHSDESSRRDDINKILRTVIPGISTWTVHGTRRTTDGSSEPVIIPALIRECKNSEGCALFEAIAYYANFLSSKLDYQPNTRFPSILMTDIGPQIGFYGCIWTGRQIRVEPLTPVYDLTLHWTDEEGKDQFASALGALLKAISRLDAHYKKVESRSERERIQRAYPFPRSFTNSEGKFIRFTYSERITDKLVFIARSQFEDAMIIKFTKQYSEGAHQALAKLQCAPALHAVVELPHGWKMVIMEHSRFRRANTLTLSHEQMQRIKDKVKSVAGMLHQAGFVHGDIRQVNLLVNESTLDNPSDASIHVIDFDWAGRAGHARYPRRINTKTVWRPDDVVAEGLIEERHDIAMIEMLFDSA